MNINKPNKNQKKINKILVFFNNFRGLKLSEYLSSKGFDVYKIITKKFLNKKIISKINNNKFKIIKNLESKKLYNFIKKEKFDLIISAGFPHIFKKKFFNISHHGIINLHAGKLPKYRGGSPLVWQIINGEKKIGLTIIKIDNKIDTGPIITKGEFKNIKKDTILEIQKKSNKLFLKLTLDAINYLAKGKKLKKQIRSKSYFKQRNDNDAKINFDLSNNKIYDLVRSQSFPYKGAYFYNYGKKFRLLKCKIKNYEPKVLPGNIFKIKNKSSFFIRCRKKSLQILKIVPKTYFLKGVIKI
ncbi:MAG: hypothetical protein CMI95_05690 [Pelagibacteraceae bacterium]|nr:hypothetical protein [Pelagibacteraceae bacterium]